MIRIVKVKHRLKPKVSNERKTNHLVSLIQCSTRVYRISRQLERGALGSEVIAAGVKIKLLAIWFCGNRSMAKGASEDRLAQLSTSWRRTPGSAETACLQ